MITDKDMEATNKYVNEIGAMFNDDMHGFRSEMYILVSRIRTESAEQARKEAAERAVRFFDDFRICVPPNKYNMPQETLEQLRAAIIGDSVIKENLTTDHKYDCATSVTQEKTDAEKLAIAVKALEKINERHSFADIVDDSYIISRDALKEIQ